MKSRFILFERTGVYCSDSFHGSSFHFWIPLYLLRARSGWSAFAASFTTPLSLDSLVSCYKGWEFYS